MKPLLTGCLALLISFDSAALTTAQLPDASLHALGRSLAEVAGSSQWQQLWQRARAAGYFNPHGPLHFSLAQAQLPAALKRTLNDAHSVAAEGASVVRFRRDFHPTVIGRHGQARLSAVCLWVDLRTLPQPLPGDPRPYLSQAVLLRAQPC